MSTLTRPGRSGADVAVAVALFALPWVTAAVKLIAAGWMTLIYMIGLVVFIPLYVLVIVIAISGFIGRRPAFLWAGAGRTRARVAAWLHATSFLVATAFLEDGGDSGGWQSPIEVVSGVDLSIGATGAFFYGFAIISPLALIWLVVEWIVALVKRRRATVAP